MSNTIKTMLRDAFGRRFGRIDYAAKVMLTGLDAKEIVDALSHPAEGEPVPMILYCPMCCERHVDAGEFATKVHHTHACQGCGHVWRPALVATVGVQFLPGFKDAS